MLFFCHKIVQIQTTTASLMIFIVKIRDISTKFSFFFSARNANLMLPSCRSPKRKLRYRIGLSISSCTCYPQKRRHGFGITCWSLKERDHLADSSQQPVCRCGICWMVTEMYRKPPCKNLCFCFLASGVPLKFAAQLLLSGKEATWTWLGLICAMRLLFGLVF